MVLAALRDDAYNAVLVLHLVSIAVAFAPAVVNPIAEARIRKEEGEAGVARHYRYAVRNSTQVHFPALVLIGLFGGALIGMSKTGGELVWQFEQTWVWAGILVWLALCVIVFALIVPIERRIAAGDVEAAKKMGPIGGLATLLFVVQLYFMVFKPGA
jgi:hypothetical protein